MDFKKNIIVINTVLLLALFINFAEPYLFGREVIFNFNLQDIVPEKIGYWESKELPISDYILKAVDADSQIWKHYYDGNGNKIEVWIAFYKDQLKSTAHNPNTCYNGQGWATKKIRKSLMLYDGEALKLSKMVLTKDNDESLSYYWYMPAGKNAGNEFTKNLYKLYYGIIKKRRDLMFLRFSVDIESSLHSKEELLEKFIKTFFSALKQRFPESYFS